MHTYYTQAHTYCIYIYDIKYIHVDQKRRMCRRNLNRVDSEWIQWRVEIQLWGFRGLVGTAVVHEGPQMLKLYTMRGWTLDIDISDQPKWNTESTKDVKTPRRKEGPSSELNRTSNVYLKTACVAVIEGSKGSCPKTKVGTVPWLNLWSLLLWQLQVRNSGTLTRCFKVFLISFALFSPLERSIEMSKAEHSVENAFLLVRVWENSPCQVKVKWENLDKVDMSTTCTRTCPRF